MENRSQIWIAFIVIAIFILKLIWDELRAKLPVVLRRIICYAAYGGALFVYIFCYDDWFIKLLGLLFVPLATCLLLFGKWKEWPSFRDFINDFYQSDGLLLMSIIVIGFWIMFMI
ncbi:MAG: hypothetical protein ACI4F4_04465 [Lachnospiraceae bacterium]